MERRKSTTLQMTQGHSSGTTEQNNSITNPPFTRKAKSDKRTLGQNRATRTPPSVRPHPGRHGAPPRSDAHGSKRQTGRPDVHKAPGRSQLSKYGTGGLGPNDLTRTNDFTQHNQTARPEQTPSPGATRRAHPNGRPHPARHGAHDQTDAHGSKR